MVDLIASDAMPAPIHDLERGLRCRVVDHVAEMAL
jgi:hypothetical protein